MEEEAKIEGAPAPGPTLNDGTFEESAKNSVIPAIPANPVPASPAKMPQSPFEVAALLAAERKKAEAEMLKKFVAAKLIPGDFPNPNAPLSECRPCGQCDGVFFLDNKLDFDEISEIETIARASGTLQKQALRYLRPMSRVWYAHWVHLTQGSTKPTGTSRPQVDFLITPEMRAIAAKSDIAEVGFKRRIRWMFTQDEHCIDAVQPKHRGNFRVFPVTHLEPEGIWGVLYLP